MNTLTIVLLALVVLAIIGLGVSNFFTGVFSGVDKVRNALPGLDNVTNQFQIPLEQTQPEK